MIHDDSIMMFELFSLVFIADSHTAEYETAKTQAKTVYLQIYILYLDRSGLSLRAMTEG